MIYVADLETTTKKDDCRVWAAGICEIDTLYFEYGNNLDWLMNFMQNWKNRKSTYYFHNLKFDGEFILCWLFEHNFTYVRDHINMPPKSFTALISGQGQFYSIEIKFNKNNKVKIYDSLKILPFKVKEIAKAFDLPIQKGEIDYTKERPVGYEPDDEEVTYLQYDCEIVARAVKILYDQGDKKMTTASNAFTEFKNSLGEKSFIKFFPPPAYDWDIRQSYKGGYAHVKKQIKGFDMGAGIVLDVNSLYPWVMHEKMLPYGEGVFFKGKYKYDKTYPLYIQMFTCNFKLKPNHLPTIQIRDTHSIFRPNEYLESSEGEDVTLCLTSVELELFFKHYDVFNPIYLSGWKFKCTNTIFRPYVDKWYSIKTKASIEKNKALKTLAKLKLNSLYGRFALNPKITSKHPIMKDGRIYYKTTEPETRKPIYIPAATFITAWARYTTISAAQQNYDRFCYADTDSLHLVGTELPKGIKVDPYELGAWKLENEFTRARFLRAKSYIEEVDGKLMVTCAGMPATCYDNVTWENYHIYGEFPGKLVPKHVKGGIVLEATTFTIRP